MTGDPAKPEGSPRAVAPASESDSKKPQADLTNDKPDFKSTPEGRYEEFLLTEYNNIATAFFHSATTITSFFQYYLLIVALPATAASLLVKLDSEVLKQFKAAPLCYAIPLLFLVVAAVGFCVMVYIVNLRLDALVYARTVNGIRKYFVDRSPLSEEEKQLTVVLPISTDTPPFHERTFFSFVVGAFAVFDCAYLLAAFVSVALVFDWFADKCFRQTTIAAIVICAVAWWLHFKLYRSLTLRRERLGPRVAPHGTTPGDRGRR